MGNKLPILINPDFLNNLLKEPIFNEKYRILETHFGVTTQEDYNKGHIKKAIFFDTLHGTEPSKYFPRDVPKPEAFKKYLSELGISNKHHIILYDRSQYGFFASSRVWFHLRLFGHENVSILSGGINAWQKNNFEISTEIQNFPKDEFKIKENKNLIRNYEDILKSLETKKEQLIDARPRDDFNKENAKLGQNHIPTAKNVPYSELFDPSTGTLKDQNQLLEMFKKEGVDLHKQSIIYCNTSVTGSTLALAAYLLGAEKIPVYKGSWTEYSLRKEEELTNAAQN